MFSIHLTFILKVNHSINNHHLEIKLNIQFINNNQLEIACCSTKYAILFENVTIAFSIFKTSWNNVHTISIFYSIIYS